MQNLDSFCPLGAILGAPSHTKLDFAIPLLSDCLMIYFVINTQTRQNLKLANNISLTLAYRIITNFLEHLVEESNNHDDISK